MSTYIIVVLLVVIIYLLLREPKNELSHKDFRIASQERFIEHIVQRIERQHEN